MNNLLQRTDAWHLARLGRLTASRFGDAVAETKNGWGASRGRYISELVTERLTGKPYPRYSSREMQEGTEREPKALLEYSCRYDCDVDPVGFVPHPTIDMSGASPDGLVGTDGLVEVKCPATHTHLEIRKGRTAVPKEYLLQVHWQMICTDRLWCDWVSFDPRLPTQQQLFRMRILRSSIVQEKMEAQAIKFLEEVAREHEEQLRD